MRAFLLTLVVIYLVWLWSSGTRTKIQATGYCQSACKEMGVQFLDQTVVLNKFGLGRGADGWPNWQRVYEFDFTLDGAVRHKGQVAVTGTKVSALHLDHPDGAIILKPEQPPAT